jgi:hypothetical protein
LHDIINTRFLADDAENIINISQPSVDAKPFTRRTNVLVFEMYHERVGKKGA